MDSSFGVWPGYRCINTKTTAVALQAQRTAQRDNLFFHVDQAKTFFKFKLTGTIIEDDQLVLVLAGDDEDINRRSLAMFDRIGHCLTADLHEVIVMFSGDLFNRPAQLNLDE